MICSADHLTSLMPNQSEMQCEQLQYHLQSQEVVEPVSAGEHWRNSNKDNSSVCVWVCLSSAESLFRSLLDHQIRQSV